MDFHTLHNQDTPLLIANVWDVPSARIAEQLKFQAIGTSSSAIASCLGYQDGEEISFSELNYIVEQISKNTNLPLSVDLESGYSRNPQEIIKHIKELAALGVVGINIEDSFVKDKRILLDEEKFAQTISEIDQYLREDKVDVFINVRIDTFLLNVPNTIIETKKRIKLYTKSGANRVFVPCIEKASDIKEIINCMSLPLNVMCMPNLPDFETLKTLGVKRISMGNFMYENMYRYLKFQTEQILHQKSFKPIL